MTKSCFAVNVNQVLSILEMQQITEIPNAPNFLKGMINLRGSVLPVIDSRVRFGMTPTQLTSNTCIIVLDIITETTELKVGAMVDSVNEVMDCTMDDIKPVPAIGTKYHADNLFGMIQQESGFIMVLNTNKVFAFAEALTINNEKIEAELT
ncbi:MAG: chemotaxis protein CheW [Salinivirgaceae bacterium]|nr:chemotaxis protein CheW [Salinivirgaceae bacterium]